jgi:hypothetical protein
MKMRSDPLVRCLELVPTLKLRQACCRTGMKCYSVKIRQEELQLFETRKCPI